jgi:uncharacterized protein YndB with AHSA1/START domain
MKLPPIKHQTFINAPPEAVYECLTTSDGWNAWFTSECEIDARAAGKIHLRWNNFGPNGITIEDGGPVLSATPNTELSFKWSPGDSQTTVQFSIEPRGAGSVVRVNESGHTTSQADLAALIECAAGWGEALTLLKFYLEHKITYGPIPPTQSPSPEATQDVD